MRNWKNVWLSMVALACALTAQDGGPVVESAAQPAVKRPMFSEASRAALAAARAEAMKVRGLEGDAQTAALEAAAKAYDRAANEVAAEPKAAAQASFSAAELWRRQGSIAEAERCYLSAAQLDAERYAQRGKLGAADMQRRAQKHDLAIASYRDAAAIDPTTSRAQTARVWVGRVLQSMGREVDAVVALRAAVASATTTGQTIEAINHLATALIAGGDLQGAAVALAQADAAVSTAIVEKPEEAERLHKALESMTARRALQRAQDKSLDTASDAAQLEKGEG